MLSESEEIVRLAESKDELQIILQQLERLKQGLYIAGSREFKVRLEGDTELAVANIIIRKLDREHLWQDISKIDEWLQILIAEVKEIRTITLELPITLSKEALHKIHVWITDNISQAVVMDVVKDESVIAGARIIYMGKYTDYTLNNLWGETWKKVNQREPEIRSSGV